MDSPLEHKSALRTCVIVGAGHAGSQLAMQLRKEGWEGGIILIGAALFNYFIETSNLPFFLVDLIEGAGLTPVMTLLCIVVFYLLLGCVMDALSMVLLTIPFIFPIVSSLGFDPVWFGIIVVTVAEIGLITPPVGMNLFVIQGAASDVRQSTIFRGIVPFLMADLVRIALLLLFPVLVLWLPGKMF